MALGSVMSEKKCKGYNPKSLKGLNPRARYLGKKEIRLTLLPDNIKWLKKCGNASRLVDLMVSLAREGKLVIIEEKNEKSSDF
jgi:hypothetical protein